MILVINKKMVAAADKPGISVGYFSSEKLQKHFSSTVLGVFRQQKREAGNLRPPYPYIF